MKKYIVQLQRAMSVLRQMLKVEDNKARIALSNMAKQELHIWNEGFSDRLADTQAKEATLISQAVPTPLLSKQKTDLLEQINLMALGITRLHGDLVVSSASLSAGLNGCTEHATLMFLILCKEFLFVPEVLIESMSVVSRLNPKMNHNFLVLNRSIGGDKLTDIASWGDNCLIIDTWLGVIATPAKMPKGSSVHAFLNGTNICTMDVRYSNQWGMKLDTYPQGHLLHQIERDTQCMIKAELKALIDKYTATLNLPWLVSAALSTRTVAASYSLFPPANDVGTSSAHQQLCSQIEQICASKYQEIMVAIEAKQYALALRKACGVGQTAIVGALVNYKEILCFDINEPSKSNGKTAFDWATERGSTECVALLEQHGGKSGLSPSGVLS